SVAGGPRCAGIARAWRRQPRAGHGGRGPGLGPGGRDRAPITRRFRGASGDAGPVSRIFRLRVEEVIALVFLLPTTYLTLVAGVYAREVGSLGDRHRLGIIRVAVAAVFLAALFVAHRFWPRSPWARGLREVLPFLTCILIY